jgi:hypothetical protein
MRTRLHQVVFVVTLAGLAFTAGCIDTTAPTACATDPAKCGQPGADTSIGDGERDTSSVDSRSDVSADDARDAEGIDTRDTSLGDTLADASDAGDVTTDAGLDVRDVVAEDSISDVGPDVPEGCPAPTTCVSSCDLASLGATCEFNYPCNDCVNFACKNGLCDPI